ncbi:FG-GAP repeat protein [Streptomyces sp. NPDC008086]|uniref:FG-GAP repeat protein n=1 Tax=Streptomyces sp. NPDC008086 TaxID=3364807 RepID=UPI0036EF6456
MVPESSPSPPVSPSARSRHPAVNATPANARAAAPSGRPAHDDFHGDGYADLAVAAPEATVDGKVRAGYVAVVYGAASGQDTGSHQVVRQNAPGVPDSAETDDGFGGAVGSADLDQDGYADLTVGVTGEDSVEGGAGTGLVQVVRGGADGLSGGAALAYGHDTYDRLSARAQLAVGDVDGDGAGDLVVIEGLANPRVVKGLFGRDGSTGAGERIVHDDSDPRFLAPPSAPTAGDAFGRRTTHLVDGDGRAELVVAAPGEDANAGSVWVRSTSAGTTASGCFAFGAGTLGTVAANAKLGSGFTY